MQCDDQMILLHEHTSTLQLWCQLINQSGLGLPVGKESFLSCSSFHVALKQNVSRYGLSGAALLFSCFG